MNFSIDVEYSKCPNCEGITLNFNKNVPIDCDKCQESKLTHSIGDLKLKFNNPENKKGITYENFA